MGCEHHIHWAIFGGESGSKARPCNPRWIRRALTQLQDCGVKCFVKQLGSYVVIPNDAFDQWPDADRLADTVPANSWGNMQGDLVRIRLRDRKGADMAEWSEDLRVRDFPGGAAC
jgi:hypothetical protein